MTSQREQKLSHLGEAEISILTDYSYCSPTFIKRVRKMGEKLRQPELFERCLTRAQNGNVHAMITLKDYGLLPHTLAELREQANEWAESVRRLKPRTGWPFNE